MSFSQISEMIGANRATRREERIPNNTANRMEVFTAFMPLI